MAAINHELLQAAADRVAAERERHDVGTLSSGIDTALTLGKALGRFCARVEKTLWEEPDADALDAVVALAVFALHVSTASQSLDAAERESEHALRLTQSAAHAGRSELRDRPGQASWPDWLQTLVGSASDTIDAACHCRMEPDTELHAVHSEHHHTPEERLELEARNLLTTCLQALALFGGNVRT